MRYTFSVTSTALVTLNDLTLTFYSDINSGNIGMDISNSPNFTGIEGPASWGPVSFVDPAKGAIMGAMSCGSGQALSFPIRRIFSHVLGQAVNTTISARAVLQCPSYAIAITMTVDSFIMAQAPLPTQQPSLTATPFAGLGQMVCYPQPARDQLCFGYQVASGGGAQLDIKIYNIAFQLAAELKGNSKGGQLESNCVNVSGMAPGVYFYKATVGSFSFPMGQFGISR